MSPDQSPDQGSKNERDLSRRAVIGIGGMSAAALALGVGTAEGVPLPVDRPLADPPPVHGRYPFMLGVASGDPTPNSVVLWTRVATDPLAADGYGGMTPTQSYPVNWEVAEDPEFTRIVRTGQAVATPELGFSVHPEVTPLQPGTEYFYRFSFGGGWLKSPVGRTKTAPAADADVQELTFALASCQAYTGGRYAAYRTMAQEDLDFVLHVGDYIYEGGATRTLTDFRLLYSTYKLSPDLQAAHARFPFVVTFDDHEVDNNWAGRIPQDSTPNFPELMANAFQAYYENLPLRLVSKPSGATIPLYRKLTFGNLAEVNVMDTRQYRTNQATEAFIAARLPGALDPNATMTGATQDSWLHTNLTTSQARWNVLAQQTIMAPYDYDPGSGISINHDAWDGYVAARDRLLRFLTDRGIANPVVLSGDWHSHWVNDLKQDYTNPAAPIVASEFVTTSISSGCGWVAAVEAARSANPHVKFFNGTYRGYAVCHVTPEIWRTELKVVEDPVSTVGPVTTLAAFQVADGVPGAVQVPHLAAEPSRAPTMFAGEASQVSVGIRNATSDPVEVTVRLQVPEGWRTEPVARILAAGEAASIDVPLTPPDGTVPRAEQVGIQLDSAGDLPVHGLRDDLWVVSTPRGGAVELALDWGPEGGRLLETFQRLTAMDAWSATRGYGWVGRAPVSLDRGTYAVLQRDYLAGRDTPSVLRLAVPPGRQRVYVLSGAPDVESGNTIIHENATLLAESGNTIMPKGELRWLAFELDGGAAGHTAELRITGALRHRYWTIQALVMTAAPGRERHS